jgi:isochorismate synthase
MSGCSAFQFPQCDQYQMKKALPANFLLWREPDAASFTLYNLAVADDTAEEYTVFAPFIGSTYYCSTQGVETLRADKLLSLELASLAVEINEPETQKEAQIQLLDKAIARLKVPTLKKVVLARNKVIEGAYNPIELFLKFSEAYPNACVFLFHTPESGCWMGATPERLLAIENGIAKAASLAGTRPVNSTGDWREKELEEQAIVTQSIKNTFAAAGLSNIQSSPLETQQAGPVEHLFCEVSGTMPEGLSPHALAKALHPTPAVGGLPKKQALSFIANHEKLNRSFYAGYFGVTSKNEAHFYVNLRSMQLFTNGLVLYAGGGITAASNPSAEWEETERKLRTLLDVIEDQ